MHVRNAVLKEQPFVSRRLLVKGVRSLCCVSPEPSQLVWTAATTGRRPELLGAQEKSGENKLSSLLSVQFKEWRREALWTMCVMVQNAARTIQFTFWLCPLFSEWAAAARAPAWSHRSPGSVVAPAPASPLSPSPAWPAVLLFYMDPERKVNNLSLVYHCHFSFNAVCFPYSTMSLICCVLDLSEIWLIPEGVFLN